VQKIYDFIKTYVGLFAALGFSFVQLLNLRPSDQSLPAFVFFTACAIAIIVYSVGVLRETRLVRRGAALVRERVHSTRARRLAGAYLVAAPVLYAVLAVAFHIPNTWPLDVRAGAEAREGNPWIAQLPGGSLLGLDEEVGPLFVPDAELRPDRTAIHHVVVYNRSTVPSPPLELQLDLQTPAAWSVPPARIFAAAVASPARRGWLPWDRPLPAAHWLPYNHGCAARLLDTGWCFYHPPDDRRNWLQPALRFPSIPARGSVEVFLEMALPPGAPVDAIPAILTLRQTGDGRFLVGLRKEIDLHAPAAQR
jgi:hypothetical protein